MGTKSSKAGKGAAGLGTLSLAVAVVVAEPVPAKQPPAWPFRMEYIGRSPGCLRKTEKTQKERMALVVVRVKLVNVVENNRSKFILDQSLRPEAAASLLKAKSYSSQARPGC